MTRAQSLDPVAQPDPAGPRIDGRSSIVVFESKTLIRVIFDDGTEMYATPCRAPGPATNRDLAEKPSAIINH